MKKTGRIQTLLMAVLTVLLSLGYVSSTMCWHSHVINGKVIVHSHFYGKAHTCPAQDGGHTTGQLQLIQEANEQTCTQVTMPGLHLERVDVLTDVFSCPGVLPASEPVCRQLPMRAPPVYCNA